MNKTNSYKYATVKESSGGTGFYPDQNTSKKSNPFSTVLLWIIAFIIIIFAANINITIK
jgi:hypothetical protein